jgi:hypothetical protein
VVRRGRAIPFDAPRSRERAQNVADGAMRDARCRPAGDTECAMPSCGMRGGHVFNANPKNLPDLLGSMFPISVRSLPPAQRRLGQCRRTRNGASVGTN